MNILFKITNLGARDREYFQVVGEVLRHPLVNETPVPNYTLYLKFKKELGKPEVGDLLIVEVEDDNEVLIVNPPKTVFKNVSISTSGKHKKIFHLNIDDKPYFTALTRRESIMEGEEYYYQLITKDQIKVFFPHQVKRTQYPALNAEILQQIIGNLAYVNDDAVNELTGSRHNYDEIYGHDGVVQSEQLNESNYYKKVESSLYDRMPPLSEPRQVPNDWLTDPDGDYEEEDYEEEEDEGEDDYVPDYDPDHDPFNEYDLPDLE